MFFFSGGFWAGALEGQAIQNNWGHWERSSLINY